MAMQVMVQGEALDVLRGVDDGFFDCLVTSPPYWGLRDYGLDPLIWDAVDGCEHEWETHHQSPKGGKNTPENPANTGADRHTQTLGFRNGGIDTDFCSLCGAWRGSLGLEPTFHLYIQHLIQIFDEVKRVLKPEGTCWVNLGDSYSGSGRGLMGNGVPSDRKGAKQGTNRGTTVGQFSKNQWSVKPKSLCQIPSRFAIAMTDAGWILRNEIIWYKRNCMPSSAKDRFTVDFEKLFFFTKSKKYWFEQQTEPAIQNQWGGHKAINLENSKDTDKQFGGLTRERDMMPENRNKRCVWDITTKPFKDAHFAVFPPGLVEPMLSAGCPVDGWVCDPFAGAGTVGMVAKEQGKNFIGIELNPDYCKMADERIG